MLKLVLVFIFFSKCVDSNNFYAKRGCGCGVARGHKSSSIIIFPSRNCREDGCPEWNVKIKEVEFGGGLRVYTKCAAGHKLKWESTEFYNKVHERYYLYLSEKNEMKRH
jgi:hypothetical protein